MTPAPVRPLHTVAARPERRTRWTDAELMATHFPEPRWAVPGLLCEGVNLLAGKPKLGQVLALARASAPRSPTATPPSARSRSSAARSCTARWKTPGVGCNAGVGRCSPREAEPHRCSPSKPRARP